MHVDLSFADGYEVTVLQELPNTSTPRRYFPPVGAGGHDGILLSISPNGAVSWIGQFAFGELGTAVSAVFALPSPEQIAVVARGAGYVVHTRRPEEWHGIKAHPVRQVRVLRYERLVLFVDWIRIAAYGVNGFAWRSERLCWDDLSIVGVEQQTVLGSGYDVATDSTKTFRLDVRTGRVIETQFKNLP